MKVEKIIDIAKEVLLSEIVPSLDRIDGRLDEMSCRFSDLNKHVNVLETRVDQLQNSINQRIGELQKDINQRIDSLQINIDQKINRLNERFDSLTNLVGVRSEINRMDNEIKRIKEKLTSTPVGSQERYYHNNDNNNGILTTRGNLSDQGKVK